MSKKMVKITGDTELALGMRGEFPHPQVGGALKSGTISLIRDDGKLRIRFDTVWRGNRQQYVVWAEESYLYVSS